MVLGRVSSMGLSNGLHIFGSTSDPRLRRTNDRLILQETLLVEILLGSSKGVSIQFRLALESATVESALRLPGLKIYGSKWDSPETWGFLKR
ncbi:hypothetical protein LENED_008124 [Lentinula edodes]|uniref:Uncharacterized protein n=1 Tax=Lentinula edodes TaxID=5353 RepID=A0A1Q3EGA8_LENED|nr:hypothetical protein LENED_008124 [Lentinula edodes]